MKEIRDNFWHGSEDPKTKSIPNRDTRRRRMLKHLTDAFDNPKKEFTFLVGGRQVCEMAYLRILGMLCCKIVRNAHSS